MSVYERVIEKDELSSLTSKFLDTTSFNLAIDEVNQEGSTIDENNFDENK